MSSILPLLKLGCMGGAVATTAAAGGLGIYYHKEVGAFLSSLGNAQKKTSKFFYVVAEFAAPTTQDTTKTLFTNKNQNFLCKISDTDIEDTGCFIYKLSAGSDESSISVNLKDIKEEKNEVKQTTDLTAKKNYLVKLTDTFYEKLKSSAGKNIKLVDKSTKSVDFGSFTLVSGIATEDAQQKVNIHSSSIFVIKLNETVTGNPTIAEGDSLTCQIGSADIQIPCKAYKLTNENAIYSKTNVATLTKPTTTADLTAGKYLLIDLQRSPKTIKEVENQVILLKSGANSTNTPVAKGLVEQILIGSITEATSTTSELLIVENANSSLTEGTIGTKTPYSYVLTQGGEAHKFLKTETYTKTNYQCRVVVGTEKYEDDTCELFPFGETPESYQLDLSKLTSAGEITSQEKFGTDKHQIVKLAKTLHDKLKALEGEAKKIEIIKKDRATSAWNHRLVSLSHIADLAEGDNALTTLSSNVLLVRAKANATDSTALTSETALKCTIGDASEQIPCKLYKFTNPKKTNVVTPTEVTSLTDSLTVSTDVKANQYYVVELTGTTKTIAELKNKDIAIKKDGDSSTLTTATFDQLLFGKPKVTGALAARKEQVYIVEKSGSTDNWDTAPLTSPYRCKLTAASGSSTTTDNYDDGCKVTKISATDTQVKLIPTAQLKSNPTNASSGLTLKSDTDDFYRLQVDLNKLYNIDVAALETSTTEIVVEVLGSDDATKTLGKLKLLHDITTDNSAKGKTDLILGKVTATTASGSLTGGQCNFTSATAATDTPVACTVFKTGTGTTDFTKDSFTTAVTTEESFEKDKYFLIKLTQPQLISTLQAHQTIYYKPTDTSKPAATISIEGILGGKNASDKKLYYLYTKTSS